MKEIRSLAMLATAVVGVHVFHGAQARERSPVSVADFAPLLAYLPPTARVGYVFDPKRLDAATGRGVLEQQERFLCAMQALAPRLVRVGMEPEFVLVDGHPGELGSPPATHALVADFGNGVRLWRRH